MDTAKQRERERECEYSPNVRRISSGQLAALTDKPISEKYPPDIGLQTGYVLVK